MPGRFTSTLVAYSAAELIYGYGFLAVFVAAAVFRREERNHDYHQVLHAFTDQLERVAVIGLLVVLGGAFLGGILSATTAATVISAAVFVLLVRPVAGWIGLTGLDVSPTHRWTMAVFGIRGIGSIYYLAYALRTSEFTDTGRLWLPPSSSRSLCMALVQPSSDVTSMPETRSCSSSPHSV